MGCIICLNFFLLHNAVNRASLATHLDLWIEIVFFKAVKSKIPAMEPRITILSCLDVYNSRK